MARYPCALTIAGSDSGGGAGIQADLKTFAALGVYGASVITAITAQNTCGVRAVYDLPPHIVAAQLDAVLDDLPITVVKIGMLSGDSIIRTVADRLRAHRISTVVLDPVMLASSGASLLNDSAVASLIAELFPLATLITPNLPEAARLMQTTALDDLLLAGRTLLDLGPAAVLIKGGHSTNTSEITDTLVTRAGTRTFSHPRLPTPHTHGTGCALSSAIAAGLAHELPLEFAVEQAIIWLSGAIAHAWPLGDGNGPVHHCWEIWS